MADIEVPHPGASDIVGRLLSDSLIEHPDVEWLGLVSEDGFAIASEGVVSVDDDAVAAGAVRLMIQVRAMSAALGQSGTPQLFLEGSESGICVMDKDPWVLVVVGKPGVPIGLLRYEAREIAEAFPMGRRPALAAALHEEEAEPQDADWAVVTTGGFVAGEFDDEAGDRDLDLGGTSADDSTVTEADGEPEIRWADEPTTPDFPAAVATADGGFPGAEPAGIFSAAGADAVEELEMPSMGSDDFSDWLTPETEPSPEAMFGLAPPAADSPVSFEMPAPTESAGAAFDMPAPTADGSAAFDMPPPAGFTTAADDLSDLAPPAGPPIDLPAPTGPAFELPPPE